MHKKVTAYASRIKRILTSPEISLLRKLSSPQKVQDYLNALPTNFEPSGETIMSPRRVLRAKVAHCIEGAFLAAAAFAFHGREPLLLDFQTTPDDEDHVVTVFRQNGLWGAVSKTNHAVLRYREPVYRTIRELAMSYFHEYTQWDGRKTLRAYSKPFDLSTYAPERWVIAEEDLDWLAEALDDSPHFPIAPKKIMRRLRRADKVELRALKIVEWKKPRNKKRQR
jgi:hypothetical protein